jgi:hypothetical protein
MSPFPGLKIEIEAKFSSETLVKYKVHSVTSINTVKGKGKVVTALNYLSTTP